MQAGFVRATQLPQFTQTQALESSLVAGLRDSQHPGLAAGTGNRPQHQGGVKGGTQLFTINEEAGGLESVAGDDEGFIAPQPVAKRRANFS